MTYSKMPSGARHLRRSKADNEGPEQVALYSWKHANRRKYQGLGLLHHIPNGGNRSGSEGARFKAEGVKPGVSDNFLPVSRRGFHGLYIEMKPQKKFKSTVSAYQRDFIIDVRAEGYAALVTYGAKSAIEVIQWYYSETDTREINDFIAD